MAGRGRGRGKATMSINPEQFGFTKGEAIQLPPVLQPPMKYPPLDYKAPPFQFSAELSYFLQLKRDYEEVMKESTNNVQPIVIKKDIERYSDRYQDMMIDKSTYEKKYNWLKIPKELKRSGIKKKIITKDSKNKKMKKDVDVEKKLQELEKKEDRQHSDAEEEEKEDDDGDEKDPDDNPEEEEAEVDEEMDDGTDYMNNYFDNGEGYEDEEDNLDDGPIY